MCPPFPNMFISSVRVVINILSSAAKETTAAAKQIIIMLSSACHHYHDITHATTPFFSDCVVYDMTEVTTWATTLFVIYLCNTVQLLSFNPTHYDISLKRQSLEDFNKTSILSNLREKWFCMSLFPINKIVYMLFIVQFVFDWDRIKESLASLLISEQELLYAVKVESIVSLFTKPSSNIICKECMA